METRVIFKFLATILFILSFPILSCNAISTVEYSDNIQTVYLSIDKSILNNLSSKNPLYINFCRTKNREYCSPPAPNMQNNGQKIIKGIVIEPKIEGEWRFADYNGAITFTPKNYWTAEQAYKVIINPIILPNFIALEKDSVAFITKPLLPTIKNISYIQDSSDPTKKFVQANIIFNYPIEPKSLEERLIWKMIPNELNDKISWVTTYNGDKTEANVVTPIKNLTKDERVLSLSIAEGVQPLYGGENLTYEAIAKEEEQKKKEYSLSNNTSRVFYNYKEQVLLPSIYSYLKVTDSKVHIVKNDKFIPEQILTVKMNAPVSMQELKDNLEIFLLPKDKPVSFAGGFGKKDYEWRSPAEITEEILKQSEKIAFESLPIINEHSIINSFKINTFPARYLFLRLQKGIKSFSDFILGKEYVGIIKIPSYPKEIKIMSDGAILSLSGEKKLSIYSLGMDKLKLEIDKISYKDINHLLSQSYSNSMFADPKFKNWAFNEYNISKVFEDEITLNSKDSKTPQYSTFDFSNYIENKISSDKDNKGLFFIKIYNKGEGENEIIEDKRLILLTDIGFLVKKNQEGSQNIFVVSIKNGKPIKGAKIEVIGLNGQAIANAVTDNEGQALLPDIRGFTREKEPTAYTVRYGKDLSFMPYGRVDREVNYSKFDTSGVVTSAKGLKAYLFSDRALYKPGENGHIGIVVKQANWQSDFEGLPLELEVINPRGQIIDNKKIVLNKEGFVEYLFNSNESSPTGTYNIILYITKDGRRDSQLGSTTARVEDFLPDRMKITSNFNIDEKKLWINSASLIASVNLNNLYGVPAINRKVSAKMTLTPAEFSVPNLKDYVFYNGAVNKNKTFNEELNETNTDEEGRAEFNLDLQKYSDATYNLNFFAEGFEPDSGRGVQVIKSILVSPYDYIVGFKSGGDLNYINQQDNCKVEFIAIDTKGEKVNAPNLKLEFKKVNYVNSLTFQQNGTYAYQSVPVEVSLSKMPINIPSSGFSYTLPTKEVGDYAFYITDANDVIFAQGKFTIVGEGNVAGSLTRNAALKLKTNKVDYLSGEEIEVNITSPYTGYGLITIETDRVNSFKWFRASTTNTVQKIKIPDNFEGKGFLNVQFVRALDSKEIYTSPFSYATTPFFANVNKRDQKITLKAPEIVKPGDELTINYSTKQPGKIAIFAVDEGILLFGKYKTPDPISYFIKNRALEVSTSHILDLILPEYSLLKMQSSSPGDGFMNYDQNLNPFKRKDQPSVVFWSGIIDSDQAEREINFKVPDYFNGSLKIMAVAASENAVGAAQARSIVRGDFVISPNIPLFVSPHDEFIVTVTIANNIIKSGDNAKVKLDIEPSEHLSIIEAPKEILISENKDNTAQVRIKATEKLGGASIKFTASLEGKQASIISTTSVRPPLPKLTTIDAGYSHNPEVDIKVARNLYDEFSKIEISTSSLPVGIIKGLKEYLESYHYGCTEQLVSKNFPNILLYDQKDIVDISNNERKIIDSSINNIFSILSERQCYDGGFSAWNNLNESNDFTSVYTMHFLTEAAARNMPIPSYGFNSGINYLKNMANKTIGSLNAAREKAYAIYILTRNNEVTTNYLANVLNYLETNYKDIWHNDLVSVYIAATYKMLQMVPEANILLNKFHLKSHVTQDSLNDYSFYDKAIKHSQYLYILALHFPERLPNVNEVHLNSLTDFINEGSYNTIVSSYAIMAALAYSNSISEVEDMDFKLKAYDQNHKEQEIDLKGNRIKTATVDNSLTNLKLISTKPNFFYQLTVSGFDKKIDYDIVEKGIELKKQYLDSSGNEVHKVKLGDTIDILLTIRSGSSKILNNIAVVDLLPGGFEVQPISSSNNAALSMPWNPYYVDRREDRIIIFGSVPNYEVQYKYRIKAVNSGNFIIPGSYAESMYLPGIYHRGNPSNIVVE